MHGEARQRPDLSERVKRKSSAETRGVNYGFSGTSDQEADGSLCRDCLERKSLSVTLLGMLKSKTLSPSLALRS